MVKTFNDVRLLDGSEQIVKSSSITWFIFELGDVWILKDKLLIFKTIFGVILMFPLRTIVWHYCCYRAIFYVVKYR